MLNDDSADNIKEAYNSTWKQYKDPEDRRGDATREETAHRVAWNAVKQTYEKNHNGKWVQKKD